MKKRFEGRGEKSKDAAVDTPIKSEDAAVGEMPMSDDRTKIEDELSEMKRNVNDLKDDVYEIKALLTRLAEGKRVEGKEDKKVAEMGVEPEDEGENQSRSGQQKPQPKPNSKKGHGRLDRETLAQLCWSGPYSAHRAPASVDASNNTLETLSLMNKPLTKVTMEVALRGSPS